MKFKLPSFVRGFLYKGIDVLWEKWFSRGYDPRRTIIVSGTARGGTTWLAESLAKAVGHMYIHEALAPHNVAANMGPHNVDATMRKVPGIFTPWEQVHPLDPGRLGISGIDAQINVITSNYLFYEHINRTVAGRVRLSTHSLGLGGLIKKWHLNILFPQRLIVKFIRGNLLLHWVLKEFRVKGTLIIRHPCAVAASQMHHRVRGGKLLVRGGLVTFESIRNHHLPDYEQFYPSFAKVIRSVKTIEEFLALEWCIRNVVPLQQPKPHPWFLTTYEGLIEDTKEWERLCGYLDCPVPTKDVITRLSSTSQRRENESSPSASIDKWRRYLSEKQIEAILRVCSNMGVDFYDKTPYPKNVDKYRT